MAWPPFSIPPALAGTDCVPFLDHRGASLEEYLEIPLVLQGLLSNHA